MNLSRISFFGILLFVILTPFICSKLLWLSRTQTTTGIASFTGKSMAGTYVHVYTNVFFIVGTDSIWFKGLDNVLFKEGEKVSVRYNPADPHQATLNNFASIWGGTLVYGGIPVILLLAIFLHPQIIPYKSRIRLAARMPLITIQPPQ
ncbi:MAG: DUF3592 domain-containing protein [Chitinophagaceae bacterium]|nr:DUF3592 domain-containing protein [Chitinophagaceae bacterium]